MLRLSDGKRLWGEWGQNSIDARQSASPPSLQWHLALFQKPFGSYCTLQFSTWVDIQLAFFGPCLIPFCHRKPDSLANLSPLSSHSWVLNECWMAKTCCQCQKDNQSINDEFFVNDAQEENHCISLVDELNWCISYLPGLYCLTITDPASSEAPGDGLASTLERCSMEPRNSTIPTLCALPGSLSIHKSNFAKLFELNV